MNVRSSVVKPRGTRARRQVYFLAGQITKLGEARAVPHQEGETVTVSGQPYDVLASWPLQFSDADAVVVLRRQKGTARR